MGTTFPYQLVFTANANTVIAASKRQIASTPAALTERIRSLRADGKIHLQGLEERAKQMVGMPPLSGEALILTDDHAPVDELLRLSH